MPKVVNGYLQLFRSVIFSIPGQVFIGPGAKKAAMDDLDRNHRCMKERSSSAIRKMFRCSYCKAKWVKSAKSSMKKEFVELGILKTCLVIPVRIVHLDKKK